MNRRHFTFLKQHQECTKRRAILSIRTNPACKDDEMAARVVNEVWESCFHDTRPFDEVRAQSKLISRSIRTKDRLLEIFQTLGAGIDPCVKSRGLVTHTSETLVLLIHFLAHGSAEKVHPRTQRRDLIQVAVQFVL